MWLTDLDAAIGDGDHGINLDRGFSAILEDLDAGRLPVDDIGALLAAAGRRLLGVVGGASGALYGRAMMTAGSRLAERGLGVGLEPSTGRRELVEAAIEGSIAGIVTLGKAVPGDKTMLDALVPALEALRTAPARPAPGARAGRRRPGGRGRCTGDDPTGGPQGAGELPRGTLRGPPGPRGGVVRTHDPLPRRHHDGRGPRLISR